MASDADASRRKHRRSPSEDDVEKSSKRYKHRHHRHHHHRSHRSKIQTEENKQEAEETIASSIPPPVPLVADSNRAVDDVEEGEILEDESSDGPHAKTVELREDKIVSQNLGAHTNNGNCGLANSDSVSKLDRKDSLPKDVRTGIRDELISRNDKKSYANGDSGRGHHKEGKKKHQGSDSSSKGSRKHHDGDPPEANETKLSNWGNSSSSEGGGEKHKEVLGSTSRSRYLDEVTVRGELLSRDFTGERSCSHSIVEKDLPLKRGGHQERVNNESDDERMTRHDWDIKHGIRDLEREKNTNYSRSFGVGDRHSSRGPQDREMSLGREQEGERIRDRDQRRLRDPEKSRDIDQRRSRDREMSRDRDQRRDRDRESSRDMDQRRDRDRERSRDREINSDRRREKWERSWDREVDRDLRRDEEQKMLKDKDRRIEKQRERSLDVEVHRDNRRDREEELEEKRKKERERSKDEDSARASERLRDRDREREKDRYNERDRARDRDWERERERRSDRGRDKSRDFKSDMTKSYNSNSHSLEGSRDKRKRDEDEQDDFEEKVTLKLAEQEEDLDRIKEESRKRRLAILEKYRNKQMQKQKETQLVNMDKDAKPAQCTVPSLPASNVTLETLDFKAEGADYVAKSLFSAGKSPPQDQRQVSERTKSAAGLGEGTPKSERSDEKYCDDIFGETPAGVRKVGNGDGLPIVRSGLHDNWDDADGYYGYRFGETLDGRYEIVAAHGKGVFSTVVRAKDLKAGTGEPEEVAIKIIRNNETMHKAGQSEVQILNKLAAEDPENKRHCVRFLSSFKYRNHLCLVFESLHMNLREILKKFGRNIGLKLTAVRAYAKQLFIVLKHLKNCHVLHCDVKPDNMLEWQCQLTDEQFIAMFITKGCKLVGSGSAVPSLQVSNDELAKIVDTNDEWISVRTGIRNRRVITGNESLIALAAEAAAKALQMADVDPDDVDLILMCTSTPEDLFGSAPQIQKALGCKKNPLAYDITAACSGFVLGLVSAACHIRGGGFKNVLVIGADALSRYVDWTDRGSCILFGDAAGAVLVQACDKEDDGFFSFDLHSDGDGERHLNAGMTQNDADHELGSNGSVLGFPPKRASYSCIHMNGKEVFRFAVRIVPHSIESALQKAGLTGSNIDWLLLHQANQRIIDAVATRLEVPSDRVISNLANYGNTSAASIPLALDEAVRSGKVKPGHTIAAAGFGAGLTWGSAIIRWG